MKIGPFISVVASVYYQEEKTVTLLARYLKESGQLTSGARGVNAPEMSPRDLAVITIGLLISSKAKTAAEMFSYFANMQLFSDFQHDAIKSRLPDPDHTLLDLMSVLCDPEVNWGSEIDFTIDFTGTQSVTVWDGEWSLMYVSREEFEKIEDAFTIGDADTLFSSPARRNGITESRSLTSLELMIAKRIVFSTYEPAMLTGNTDATIFPAVKRHDPAPDDPA